MVTHQVWFKMREGAGILERSQLMAALRELPSGISAIDSLVTGEDYSGRSRGFEVGLLVKCASREDLDIYANHPVHLAFIAKNRHLWQDVQALDFED